ncbi:hypothetical protein JXB02_06850 [Candidatus Woesearchaeota archaeon]|nr:hypothetical protein [Candidatus Woesearchaeota archaeon]
MSIEQFIVDTAPYIRDAAIIDAAAAVVASSAKHVLDKTTSAWEHQTAKRMLDIAAKVAWAPYKAAALALPSFFIKRTRKNRRKVNAHRYIAAPALVTLAAIVGLNYQITKDWGKRYDDLRQVPNATFLYLNPDIAAPSRQSRINLSDVAGSGPLSDIYINTAQRKLVTTKNGNKADVVDIIGIGPKQAPSIPFAQADNTYNTNGLDGNRIPYDDRIFSKMKVAGVIGPDDESYEPWMGSGAILLAEQYKGPIDEYRGRWFKIGPTLHSERISGVRSIGHGLLGRIGQEIPTDGCVRIPSEDNDRIKRDVRYLRTRVWGGYDTDMLLLDRQGTLFVVADHTDPYGKVPQDVGYRRLISDLTAIHGRKLRTAGGWKGIEIDFPKVTRAFYASMEEPGVYRIPLKD